MKLSKLITISYIAVLILFLFLVWDKPLLNKHDKPNKTTVKVVKDLEIL